MLLRSIATIFLASVFTTPWLFSQTGTASVSGTITGSDGKALAAMVIANRTSSPAASGHAQAGSNGAFTITKLPAGTYTLCASVKGGGYLDTCAWSTPPPTVQLAAGQALTGYKLVLTQGTTLQVRLNDPGQSLATPAASNSKSGKATPHVILGVFTPRHIFQPLALVSIDGNGRFHQGTIPINTPLSSGVTQNRPLRVT